MHGIEDTRGALNNAIPGLSIFHTSCGLLCVKNGSYFLKLQEILDMVYYVTLQLCNASYILIFNMLNS